MNRDQYDISCMSYNILSYNTGGTTFAEAEVRFPYVIKTILKYNPDIIGIQEAEHYQKFIGLDWPSKLTGVLGEVGLYDHCAIIDDKACKLNRQSIGAGLMIFFKKVRFEVVERGCCRYEEGPDRYYQWVRLHDKKFDRDVVITNTHLSINPWKDKTYTERDREAGKALRNIEAEHLRNFWAEYVKPGDALFATGDYNHIDTEPAYTTLHGDRFASAQQLSLIPDDPRKTVDYIYIDPAVTEVAQYLTCFDTFEDDSPIVDGDPILYRSSDHWATICYAKYK